MNSKNTGDFTRRGRVKKSLANDLLSNPTERDYEDANEIWEMALNSKALREVWVNTQVVY